MHAPQAAHCLVFIAIMIEIVACPWPGDVLMSNAANSKQRDKRGWNRAVLMGHLPKEIVYRSRPALRRHILESFLDSPSIRYGRGTKGDARLSLASENADLFGAGLERRP